MANNKVGIEVTAVDNASPVINRVEKSLGGLSKASSLAKSALVGITAAAAAVGYALGKTLETTAQLADTSAQLGMSAVKLQQMQNAAQMAGVGADELSAALFKLQVNIGDALIKGTGPAKTALERLNIPLQDIADLPVDEQLEKITTALGDIENPSVRSAIAVDLLGKKGQKIAELAGAAKALKVEIDGLVGSISDMDISNIDAVDDSFASLKATLTQGMQKALSDLAPYILSMVESFKQGIKWIKDNMESIIPVLKAVGLIVAGFALYISPILIVVAAVAAAFFKWPKVFGWVAKAILWLINTLIIDPLTWVVKQIFAVGSAMAALAQGENPFTAYNKAITDFEGLKLFGDVSVIQQKLIDKAKEEKTERDKVKTSVIGENEEQKKVLATYTETVQKIKDSIAFQQDVINLGIEQATIEKTVTELKQQFLKASMAMSPEREKELRDYLALEASMKRQVLLVEEKAKLYAGAFNNSNIGKEMDKLLRLQMKINDKMTDPEIEKAMQDRALAAAGMVKTMTGEDILIAQQKKAIQDSINAEIAKYDLLLAVDLDYKAKKSELDAILLRSIEDGNLLTLTQKQQLNDAMIVLDQQYNDAKIAAAQATADRLQQLELNRIQTQLTGQNGLMAQSLSDSDKAILQAAGASDEQKKIVQERMAFEKKSATEKTAWAIEQGAQMFSALGAQNKKAFEAAKALNIALAIMNTWQAASKALATYPWPFGMIAAALAVASGFAQVAQIRSQTYSGRALGGPVMGNTPYLVGESGPELFTPQGTGSITRNGDLGGNKGPVNVNFTVNTIDASGFDELLSSRKGVIQQIISDAMLERGQRSIV